MSQEIALELMNLLKEEGRIAESFLTKEELEVMLDLRDDEFVKSALFNQTRSGRTIPAESYYFLPWEDRNMEGRIGGRGRPAD